MNQMLVYGHLHGQTFKDWTEGTVSVLVPFFDEPIACVKKGK